MIGWKETEQDEIFSSSRLTWDIVAEAGKALEGLIRSSRRIFQLAKMQEDVMKDAVEEDVNNEHDVDDNDQDV